jgi:hypothetical protein
MRKCECTMQALMMNGCPSTRGGDCPAKDARLAQEAQDAKRTTKPLKVLEDEDDFSPWEGWSVDPRDFQDRAVQETHRKNIKRMMRDICRREAFEFTTACWSCGESAKHSPTRYCTSCEAFRNQEGHYP